MANHQIQAGAAFVIDLALTLSGTPVNITGNEISVTIEPYTNLPENIVGSVISGSGGTARITIPSATTAKFKPGNVITIRLRRRVTDQDWLPMGVFSAEVV